MHELYSQPSTQDKHMGSCGSGLKHERLTGQEGTRKPMRKWTLKVSDSVITS
ncbi:hypothetical protein HanPI659440_Chr08g0283141 [Helianthus annuus]|uniref:Uncharacterized protein n=1 Tax=Helianthus annuus TaxID=4232 RepID=A0A251VF13_HELAN|nr:hypothetical protein HanXRQr2_Chr13g0585311 [Helianthus annuus]KAJ0476662.1 hypothetical protein HanHA300_Chr13g0479851 [Helianthus annuus]KAJ0497483.1 hypothetical protein HanHA89_Chr13g0511871 [Helianthus annuus]KAJ0524231.1 hypothetical protein HanIR_Chr10g0502271 [Helianthus annuus]KAJ0663500.1 hypothetical protein HanLR1_Chr13g0481891 [Helianthus annuus]